MFAGTLRVCLIVGLMSHRRIDIASFGAQLSLYMFAGLPGIDTCPVRLTSPPLVGITVRLISCLPCWGSCECSPNRELLHHILCACLLECTQFMLCDKDPLCPNTVRRSKTLNSSVLNAKCFLPLVCLRMVDTLHSNFKLIRWRGKKRYIVLFCMCELLRDTL